MHHIIVAQHMHSEIWSHRLCIGSGCSRQNVPPWLVDCGFEGSIFGILAVAILLFCNQGMKVSIIGLRQSDMMLWTLYTALLATG